MLKTPISSLLHPFDIRPATNSWSWDSVRLVTLKSTGERVRRHRLCLNQSHVGILTPSMGTIASHDVGRELIVDVYAGHTVDVIQDAAPTTPRQTAAREKVRDLRKKIAMFSQLCDELEASL